MLTHPKTLTVDARKWQMLECIFDAEYFNLFDNPVLWKKTQKDEVSELALLRKINDPFARTGRFETSFIPSPPRYTVRLNISGRDTAKTVHRPCFFAMWYHSF